MRISKGNKLFSMCLAASICISCAVHRQSAFLSPSPEIRKQPGPPKLHSDSAAEAAEFFRAKRWQGPGDFPVERYLQAREQTRRLPLASISRNDTNVTPKSLAATTNVDALGTWQSLGPGNIGGRTRAIAIDPANPNTIFAGTATGGVWKTLDGGLTWAALTDFLPVLSVSSLVMDPTNSQILYLGTGEATQGDGIFKTTNGGQTWTQLPGTANSNFNFVYGIAVHPQQPNHIYAATATGISVSTDAGVTWKQTFPANPGTYTTCNSLALRGDQPTDILFVSCGMFLNNTLTYSIYRNMDAAGTGAWSVVQSDPLMGATALAIAPTAPATIYAVAITTDPTGPFRAALLGVFRSTQGGDAGTWTTQANTSDPSSVNANILSYPSCPYPTNDHHGQGSYNLNIAVDPTDANVVFVQGIDLFRSDDGGLTWGWANGVSGQSAHSDQHAFAFLPGYNGQSNQTFFTGNDGGVYRTDAARGVVATGSQAFCSAGSQVTWRSLNNGYASTQFYHGAVLPGGQGYFGGTQDNGTPLGTDSLGPNKWVSIYGGDGGQVIVDPLDANTMFYEYVYLAMRKSTDGGLSSHSVINGISENPSNFAFINHYSQDPSDPQKMYTGGSQLWRSLDEGEHWTAASVSLTTSTLSSLLDRITTQTLDPTDSNHVLFGTSTGYVYRSNSALTTDATTVWQHSQPRTGYVSRIVFDPKTPTTVYATYTTFRTDSTQSQIYRSSDTGITWIPIGNSGPASLPDLPVHVLLIDPDDSSRLYVGTDTGVFVSFDAGATGRATEIPSVRRSPKVCKSNVTEMQSICMLSRMVAAFGG